MQAVGTRITKPVMKALAISALTAVCFSVSWGQQVPDNSPPSGLPIQPLPPLSNGGNLGVRATGIADDPSLTQNQTLTARQVQPDTHSLSSAETLGLGSLFKLQQIFDPALQISEFGETGLVPGKTELVSSLGGSLDMYHSWGSYRLSASYSGAETIYRPSYLGRDYVPYYNFTVEPEIVRGRWTLRLRDSILYSWETGFGGLFTGGPIQSIGSTSITSIQPSLASNGTILTALARQLNNTALGEIDYAFSRRTTLTIVGSYDFLHFLDPGYINSRIIDGRIGYNYALSAANNFALSYDYNRVTFSGGSNWLQTDLVQASFGRKITGRLAFQMGAGPELLRFANSEASTNRQVSWSASSALTYNLPRSRYSLAYFHGITSGSGVFYGSKGDTITATGNYDFMRFWSATVDGGYAVNKVLVSVGSFTSQFNNWFAGAALSRQLGRQVRLSLRYSFQQQTNRGGSCPVLSCGPPASLSFRQFGVTLQWHPLAIQAR